MSTFIRLNTAIIPPKQVSDFALDISHKLAQRYNIHFELNTINCFPHITVYPPEYPESNMDTILAAVDSTVSKIRSFVLEIESVEVTDGWIGLHFSKNESIINLHVALIEALNPLRRGRIREKYTKQTYRDVARGNTMSYIEQYGFPGVMQYYEPHLTLSYIRGEADVTAIKAFVESELRFREVTVASLGVFESGAFGTVARLRQQFELLY